jgi:hypothetical protein
MNIHPSWDPPLDRRKSNPNSFPLALIAAVIVVALLAAHTRPSTASRLRGRDAAALAQLRTLPVVPARVHHPGYQRGCRPGQSCSFGPAWTDHTAAPGGHNGCDTRDDILRSQLRAVTYRPGSRCVVVGGLLHDPYTAAVITFSKAHAAAVQIDHVVPLALAWDLGAYAWPQARREQFANDEHLELLAVAGPANAAKRDAGPGQWMPPNRAWRSAYAARYVAVLAAYKLPVTAADLHALTAALTPPAARKAASR